MAADFPEDGGDQSADQGMAGGDAAMGHDQVQGGEQQDFTPQPDEVEQGHGEAIEPPALAKQLPFGLGQGIEGAAGEGDEQQAGTDEGNEQEGDQGRHQKVSAMRGDPMGEDHRHGILQQAEGHGGKEQQHEHAQPPDQVAIVEEVFQLHDDGLRHAGHEEIEFLPHRLQQLGLGDQVGQSHQQQQHQGDDGQQHVVGDRPGQEHALIAPEGAQDAQGEGQGPTDPRQGARPILAGTQVGAGARRRSQFPAARRHFLIQTQFGAGTRRRGQFRAARLPILVKTGKGG